MKQKITFIKSGLLAALLTGSALAAEVVKPVESGVKPVPAKEDRATIDYLSRQVEGFLGRAGVNFYGEFKARGLGSSMRGNLIDSVSHSKKSSENIYATTFDLGLRVAPHSAIQGNAMIRIHEDWRNMFASFATPITLRWLSVDGNIKNIVFYNVGDFKQKYTNLTLWAPEPEIIYEPYIFARQRKEVMNEVFAGDNNRVLQGANVNFLANIAPAFDEFRGQAYFTRTRRQGKDDALDLPTSYDSKGIKMDRYSAGGNVFMGIRKDLEVGITGLYTGDALGTYIDGPEAEAYKYRDQTTVFGFNGAFGTGLFDGIDYDKFNARLDVTVAYSIYKTGDYDNATSTVTYHHTNGLASNTNLGFKVGLGDAGKLNLDLGYIYNDTSFNNEMAQSPIFYNKQILNTGVNDERAYNSFDPLYKHVFRYFPGEVEAGYTGGIKEPMNKIAWTRGVLTKKDLDELEKNDKDGDKPSAKQVTLDRTISPVMYFGDATPNRSGVKTKFGGEFLNKAILFTTEFNMLTTPKYELGTGNTYYKEDFLQYAGGVSLDIAKFGNWWAYPFILSGSMKHTEMKNTSTAVKDKIDFVNTSLYWKFWKKAALIGGMQVIQSQDNILADSSHAVNKIVETNIAGGLEYKVSDGSILTATIGNIGSNKSGTTAANLGDYNALQLDLFLTVKF